MEYSIQELSRLSGVTTRALRWYDHIGLLKPSRVAESGYRYYGPAEVDRLQDILYYRALGVELARIRECLDDPAFDRLVALRSHLAALEAERTRLDALIQSVRDTIRCEERKEIMSDEQKFEALKQRVLTRYEQVYGKEAREKYGDDMVGAAQSASRTQKLNTDRAIPLPFGIRNSPLAERYSEIPRQAKSRNRTGI